MVNGYNEQRGAISRREFLRGVGVFTAGKMFGANFDANTTSVLPSPDLQIDRRSRIFSIIQDEFPDQYQLLQQKNKLVQLASLVNELALESHDDDETLIFGRMAGKFLAKNFLNFNEEPDGDNYGTITPEMVRVERMLLERYKEKIPLYDFPAVSVVSQNPDKSQALYKFQDIFTVLRTFRNEFDPATEQIPDKGEQVHTINAIDIVGKLGTFNWWYYANVGADVFVPVYSLIYATMAAEGVGNKFGMDGIHQYSWKAMEPANFKLSYVDRSLFAIRLGIAGASLVNSDMPDEEAYMNHDTMMFVSDTSGIAVNSFSIDDTRVRAEELVTKYNKIEETNLGLQRSLEDIPAPIRETNPSYSIDFSQIPEVIEARKISDPQERLKSMISILSVQVKNGHHPRYDYRDPGAIVDSFACNIYSTDLCEMLELPVSHRVDEEGRPVFAGGHELHAFGMFQWIAEHGPEYGWEDVTHLSYDQKNKLLSEGSIFYGATPQDTWIVGMVEGEPIITKASYDIGAMYASPYNFKINGTNGARLYAHRLPNFSS